jgi:hypothetical protein
MTGVLSDLGVPQMFVDAQGRLIPGSDLDTPANGQSGANAQQLVATTIGFKRRILYATVNYSTTVTLNATVTLLSALGAAWNTTLALIVFTGSASAIWVPSHSQWLIGVGDQIQVTAPAGGGGVTSTVAIYSEILGLTNRAVDATS